MTRLEGSVPLVSFIQVELRAADKEKSRIAKDIWFLNPAEGLGFLFKFLQQR